MQSTPQQSARVGIVTVSYHSGAVLEQLLASIDEPDLDLEVVVVENDSADTETAALAARAGAAFVRRDENPGYGGGVNSGVGVLDPDVEWILVVNPDVTLARGAVAALVGVGGAAQDVGAVGPRIITDGAVYPSARRIPSLRVGTGHAVFARVWPGNPWSRKYRESDRTRADDRRVGWLSGACVLVRRSVFDALGGFDEGYFMYFEDVDLGDRIGRLGYRNVYAPEIVVEHSGGHTADPQSPLMIDAHHRSAARYLAGRYPGPLLAPLRVALRAGLAIRARVLVGRAHRRRREAARHSSTG